MPSFTDKFVFLVNMLQVLIETYGPNPFSWKEISSNPNLTIEMIKDYYLHRKNIALNWENISEIQQLQWKM